MAEAGTHPAPPGAGGSGNGMQGENMLVVWFNPGGNPARLRAAAAACRALVDAISEKLYDVQVIRLKVLDAWKGDRAAVDFSNDIDTVVNGLNTFCQDLNQLEDGLHAYADGLEQLQRESENLKKSIAAAAAIEIALVAATAATGGLASVATVPAGTATASGVTAQSLALAARGGAITANLIRILGHVLPSLHATYRAMTISVPFGAALQAVSRMLDKWLVQGVNPLDPHNYSANDGAAVAATAGAMPYFVMAGQYLGINAMTGARFFGGNASLGAVGGGGSAALFEFGFNHKHLTDERAWHNVGISTLVGGGVGGLAAGARPNFSKAGGLAAKRANPTYRIPFTGLTPTEVMRGAIGTPAHTVVAAKTREPPPDAPPQFSREAVQGSDLPPGLPGLPASGAQPPPPPPPPAPPPPPPLTVQKGESLWEIAEREYGDGSKWETIYNANKHLIKDPDIIFTGQQFTLPPVTDHGNG